MIHTYHHRMHRHVNCLVLISFVFSCFFLCGWASGALAAPASFPDLENHPAQAAIEALIRDGIIQGGTDGLFHPEDPVTRAELAVMLVKALHLSGPGPVFADTEQHWARDYISIAAAHGIVSGYDANSFGPDDIVTREQLAAMVVNAANLSPTGSTAGLPDQELISEWARSAVATACSQNIISILPDGSYGPQKSATRAVTALAIYAILNPAAPPDGTSDSANTGNPPNNANPSNNGNQLNNGVQVNTSNLNGNTNPLPGPAPLYDIAIDPVQGGTASVNVNKSPAAAGENISVSIANLETGKAVQSITVTGADGQNVLITELAPGASYIFTMPAQQATISVVLAASTVVNPQPNPAAIKYTVLIDPVQGGSADVAADASTAPAGQTVTVGITNIESGKVFESIEVLDASGQPLGVQEISAGSVYNFVMPASDVNIKVAIKDQPLTFNIIYFTFNDPVKYSVNIAPVEGGTATVSADTVQDLPGARVTINIADIQSGKEFDSITVLDSKNQGLAVTQNAYGSSYSFDLPNDDVTVKVKLKDPAVSGIIITDSDLIQVVDVFAPQAVNINPIINPMGGATVTASSAPAVPNSFVTITVSGVQPEMIKSLVVRDANTNSILPPAVFSVTPTPGSFTFVMPFNPVNVQVELYPVQVIMAFPKYAINIQSITGGQALITAENPSCEATTTAILNINNLPASKEIATIKVTTASGQLIPVTTVAANSKYSFTMPSSDVYVNVVLKDRIFKITTSWIQTNLNNPFGADEQPRAWTLKTTAKAGEEVRFWLTIPANTYYLPILNNGTVDYGVASWSSYTYVCMWTYMPAADLDIVINLTHKHPRTKG